MKLNLSSQIVLNKVPEQYYRPRTAVERSEITRCEKIFTDIYPKVEEAAAVIANTVEAEIKRAKDAGRKCVLALGTGLSLTPVYTELIRRHKECGLSFDNVVVFNAYEYFPLSADSRHSALGQLRERLLDHIDIKAENIHTPDGSISQDEVVEHCHAYEQLIAAEGGIDIALLGIGRMGNIATNEPGSTLSSTSRIILIDQMSRDEMTNSFGTQEQVPPCSITMGIHTLLSAHKLFITAWGEEKSDIVEKIVEGPITDAVPASFIQTHNDAKFFIDLSAASKLTRIVHPWLVTNCEWNDKTIRAAVVWLCQLKQKPILKLTNKDYNENGLSELLARFGSAYNCNIKIFNDLQHTITGWPGGKPNADDTNRPERALPAMKRVIVFSPHPDDDVISMGGTLRRLVQQNHDVHVAYETSGNIAVGDEEVTRFMHFVNGFNQLFCNNEDEVIKKMYADIKAFLAQKKPSDMDTPEVRTIKGLIRRGEARTACTYNGVPLSHVHFLDLPFYESGKIEKLPMSEKDVEIVRALLQKVKPHQIYVAGDLADPHGTHRVCTEAALEAIEQLKEEGENWLNETHVWLYRGAWMEWELGRVDMAVPLSPDEVVEKRHAIFRHLSQKDIVPFPGDDPREFWQRAEDRTQNTARLYDELGMAEYQAIEVFLKLY